jgi:hypothetical protein
MAKEFVSRFPLLDRNYANQVGKTFIQGVGREPVAELTGK